VSLQFEKNLKLSSSQERLLSLQSQIVRNGENNYQLLPFEASIFKLNLQGFEHRRVTIRLAPNTKAVHERSQVIPKNVGTALAIRPAISSTIGSTISNQEDDSQLAVERVAAELASVDLFERLLAEYLRTKKFTKPLDVAEILNLHRDSYPLVARQIIESGLLRGEVRPWLELPEEDQVYSLSRVLYLSNGEQEYLVEALQITRESRKLAEYIREQRELSLEQEASLQMLVNQIRQFDQQRQVLNRDNSQLTARIQWLTIGLGIATVLGALGTFYGLFFD
jgi:hypothetical protein